MTYYLWTTNQTLIARSVVRSAHATEERNLRVQSEGSETPVLTSVQELTGAQNGIINKPGWKWARKLIKNQDKFVRLARAFKVATKNTLKYKFGVRVPRN